MKKWYLTVVMFLLMLLPAASFALEATGFSGKDIYTWYGTTADNVNVSWDAPVNYVTGDSFEIQIKNPERNIVVNIPETTTFTKQFKCPKTGHWTVHVRSKRLISSVWQYSDWIASTDPTVATVAGQPRAWWLFVWITGTGPISKEDNTQRGNHKNTLSFNSLDEMGNFFASIYGGN